MIASLEGGVAVKKSQLLLDVNNESRMYDSSFSGVVQVTVDGVTMFQQYMETVDEEQQLPMTMDAVFPIGSNTKLFTAVALYQLQERGKVNLTHPINDDLTHCQVWVS
jgi:CubicO group peptidase (beta-lactamase class C family)